MADKTKKIQLEKAMTYAGVNYAPGLNTMPAAAADFAVKRKHGTPADSKKAEAVDEEFTPLPFQETIERFESGDDSEEVFQSLRFHQPTIAQRTKLLSDIAQSKAKHSAKTGQSDGGEKGKTEETGTGGQGKTNVDQTEQSGGGSSLVTDIKNAVDGQKPADGLPDNFPMRHTFDRLGFKSVADVQALTAEQLIALDGIAAPTAEKALNYGK